MTGIRRIKLAEKKIVEHEGDFIEVKENERELPAKVTNFALNYGMSKGLIDTTNLQDIAVKIESDFALALNIIYLGLVGANPTIISNLSLEEMTEQLDYEWQEVTYLAQTTLISGLPDTLDEFIEELEKMTASDDDSKKK